MRLYLYVLNAYVFACLLQFMAHSFIHLFKMFTSMLFVSHFATCGNRAMDMLYEKTSFPHSAYNLETGVYVYVNELSQY